MAQHTLGIGALTAGQNLSANGFTKTEGTGDFVVTADAAALYGKKLVFNGTLVLLTDDVVNADAGRNNIEILCIGTFDLPASAATFALWACYATPQKARYNIEYDGGALDNALVTNASAADIIDAGGATTDPGTTKQAIRYRVNSAGVTLQVRRWNYGSAEPVTWNILDLTSAHGMAALNVGLAGFRANAMTTADIEHWSVGTNGDTAPLPLLAPSNLVATDIQDHQVTVEFDDENAGAFPHRAYYREGGVGSWLEAADLQAGFTVFTFVGLEAGTEYEFAFSAFDGDDESALSTTITETTDSDSDVSGSGVALLGNLTASGTGTVVSQGPIEGSGVAVLGSLEAFGFATIPIDAVLDLDGVPVPLLQARARRKFHDLAPTIRMYNGTLKSGRSAHRGQFETWDAETTPMDRTAAIALEATMISGNVSSAGLVVGGGTVVVFIPPSSVRRREHETLAYASLSFVMEQV